MLFVDVNVLVYSHRREVDNHEAYQRWLDEAMNGEEALGIADIVLSGFIRVVTHRRIFNDPTPLPLALEAAGAVRGAPASVPVTAGERTWDVFSRLVTAAEATGNLVPDAFIAAMAMENGATLVTADRGFGRFPGLRWSHPLG